MKCLEKDADLSHLGNEEGLCERTCIEARVPLERAASRGLQTNNSDTGSYSYILKSNNYVNRGGWWEPGSSLLVQKQNRGE